MKYNFKYTCDLFDDGDMVIFDPEDKTTHILNCTASKIVDIIKNNEGIAWEDIFHQYHKYLENNFYDLNEREIVRDFKNTMDVLMRKKIVME